MMDRDVFIDIDFWSRNKRSERVCGDTFRFRKLSAERSAVAVLSDGLGSGIKASVLSRMTTAMAMKFAAAEEDVLRSAEIMMGALPECSVRKISYSTFTIMNIRPYGVTRVVEMGNPSFLLLRGGEEVDVPEPKRIVSEKWSDRAIDIYSFKLEVGDRVIVFSDGITQAGLGADSYRLGWRRQGCLSHVKEVLSRSQNISSHQLSRAIVNGAIACEPGGVCHDDMTCGVVYVRNPKKLALLTGPPYLKEHDAEYAEILRRWEGQKVVCGGTTADIVSRELDVELKMNLRDNRHDLPPTSEIGGIDLVTEGIFTLTRVANYLEGKEKTNAIDPAGRLVDLLRSNDVIEFYVGTRINEVLQDPNLPVDLEIRRNIIKRIAKTLRESYMKEVEITYM